MYINKMLFLFLGFALQAYSQKANSNFNHKATYELTYQSDSRNKNSIESEQMVLFIGDDFSKFASKGIHIKDSIRKAYNDKPRTPENFYEMQSQIPNTKFRYFIYKGIPEGKITFAERVVKDDFKYIQDKSLMKWQIEDEIDTLSGYRVQKATTNFAGRDYTAWFAPDIPFSEGPYKFNGLPGLIIKISDQRNHYTFRLTELKSLNKPIPFIFDEKKYIEATKDQFLNAQEDFYRNPTAALEKVGITLGGGSGNKGQRNKSLRKNFNPIELE